MTAKKDLFLFYTPYNISQIYNLDPRTTIQKLSDLCLKSSLDE